MRVSFCARVATDAAKGPFRECTPRKVQLAGHTVEWLACRPAGFPDCMVVVTPPDNMELWLKAVKAADEAGLTGIIPKPQLPKPEEFPIDELGSRLQLEVHRYSPSPDNAKHTTDS